MRLAGCLSAQHVDLHGDPAGELARRRPECLGHLGGEARRVRTVQARPRQQGCDLVLAAGEHQRVVGPLHVRLHRRDELVAALGVPVHRGTMDLTHRVGVGRVVGHQAQHRPAYVRVVVETVGTPLDEPHLVGQLVDQLARPLVVDLPYPAVW